MASCKALKLCEAYKLGKFFNYTKNNNGNNILESALHLLFMFRPFLLYLVNGYPPLPQSSEGGFEEAMALTGHAGHRMVTA